MMVKTCILLVEDENIVALELADTLQNLGYSVSAIASSGEQAITSAEETHPDLVLMDIRLKGHIDGIEAAEQIRARLDIPVVYLTAYADDTTLGRAKLTEPFGYLLKPFEQRELHSTIEIALYRHRMQKELREKERWLSTTLTSIGDAVVATDKRGLIVFANPTAARLMDQGPETIMGSEADRILHFVDERTRSPVQSPIGRVLQEGVVIGQDNDTLLVSETSGETPVDYSAAPLQDDHGNVEGVVLVFRDVTERRQMEQMLLRTERLAAMGHMAAALAHEINNPLQSISGSIDLLLNYRVDKTKQEEYLQTAHRELQRLMTVTHSMLDFSRPPGIERRSICISDPIRHALALSQKELEHRGIEVRISLPDDLPPVLASHDQLVQVLLNLMINALEAMSQGGRLSIEANCSEEHLEVSITDDGPGLSPEAVDRLYQPFYTTKPSGTGLGLSVSYNIMQQHGGTIVAGNAPGGGAVFTISLPLLPSQALQAKEHE
jgi:PAS domain S-box-containing protein